MLPTPLLLIPGAWMGGWIWEGTIDRLRGAGCSASTITLPGLGADTDVRDLAGIGLSDHVAAGLDAVREIGEPLTVVGHSYSGIVAGMIADRAPEFVVHTVVVAGFFPRDGRSLLDDWGSDPAERDAERRAIEGSGMVWAPPDVGSLTADAGLSEDDARWLGDRLRPHPGRTILEPATMVRSIARRSVTVIANVGSQDPRSTLPGDLAGLPLGTGISVRSLPATGRCSATPTTSPPLSSGRPSRPPTATDTHAGRAGVPPSRPRPAPCCSAPERRVGSRRSCHTPSSDWSHVRGGGGW